MTRPVDGFLRSVKSLTTFIFLPRSWGIFEGNYSQHKRSNAREASAAYHLHGIHIVDTKALESSEP